MVLEVMDNQDLGAMLIPKIVCSLTLVHCAGLGIHSGVEHYDIYDELKWAMRGKLAAWFFKISTTSWHS